MEMLEKYDPSEAVRSDETLTAYAKTVTGAHP
jgi:hypothetical protein